MTAPPAAALQIRRLTYADLPQVVAIERRAFTTPWSLAMFVLELSKPSGICLAATEGERLLGYLICSRYDRVWHLMNVAVAPEHRRRGVASGLIRRLIEEGGGGLPFTLEVRTSNREAIAMYERAGYAAIERYNRGIAVAVSKGDNGTRDLFSSRLQGEEDHADWIESQLELIRQVGLENYLSQQIHG